MSSSFTKCSQDCSPFSKTAELCGRGWMISAQKKITPRSEAAHIFVTHRSEAAEESVSLQQMCPVEVSSPRGVSGGTAQPSMGHLCWKKLANQLTDLDSTLVFTRLWNRKEQYSIIDHHITPFSALLRLQVICNYHCRGQLALTKSHNIPVLHCSQNLQTSTSCQGVTSVLYRRCGCPRSSFWGERWLWKKEGKTRNESHQEESSFLVRVWLPTLSAEEGE